jgi:HD superfamily phosphohydrolase
VADPHRRYEIRCPVHGFISISDWEREIIAQPAFQRLRRIRQLAWTDQIYPGAMHTRFEHSLGVMHVATLLYEAIVQRSRGLLKSEMTYNDEGLERDKTLVRLAALLHDLGHSPFSHAGENLFPLRTDGKKRYVHEDYSATIIAHELKSAIEDHKLNKRNFGFRVEDITSLLEGKAEAGHRLFWRELITGQMDADRMDYLLRDSLHAGVDYGRYDWRRILNTVEAMVVPGAEEKSDGQGLRLGVSEGGVHAAEALVLARYFMFTQVYFHKTRAAYDHHLQQALEVLLPGGVFPPPAAGTLQEYLQWDDWKVFGLLADGKGGEHGLRLRTRDHYREVYHTPESPDAEDLKALEAVKADLGGLAVHEAEAAKSWYKIDRTDIPVVSDTAGRPVRSLSAFSPVIKNLKPTRRVMLFSRPEKADEARVRVRNKFQVAP